MLRTEIDLNEQLFPGDEIEMHFKVFGPSWTYLRAAELAMLIYRLEQKRPEWELTAWDSTTYTDRLVLSFRVLKSNPVVVTAALIAAIVIGGGLFAWLALDKVYKIATTPAAQAAMLGTGAIGMTFLVIVGYLVLSRYYGWGD
ncbi:hypothetical protein LCGC14_1655830 [marine sediment metagenome]|uniref:Uncharacterized protein n=1 Tax=marine sediment metagenome TaxID=412755 RepID=A0A0F9II15_9ZZZZ